MDIGKWFALAGLLYLVAVLYRQYIQYRERAEEAALVEEYCDDLTPEETQKFLSLWRIYQEGTDEEYETTLGTVGDRVERAFQGLLDDETSKW